MLKAADPIVSEIWQRAAYYGIRNMVALSKATRIPYNILRARLAAPMNLTLEEIEQLRDTIGFSPDVIHERLTKKGRK